MRNPHGSVGWGGTGWKLYLGVRPLFCGAIHLQDCVWGAWCCYRTVAVEGRSFLSEEKGLWNCLEQDFLCALTWCWDGPLFLEAILDACVRERRAGPLVTKKILVSNSHTLEATHYLWQELKITLILILTGPAFFLCLGFGKACSI